MYESPRVRASDAEREAFGERLRRHHADGRLTTEEFQERIDRCYSAKTVAELEQLVTDLPAERRAEHHPWAGPPQGLPVVRVVIGIVLIGVVLGAIRHWHHDAWVTILPLALVLRFMLWGRYRRRGVRA